MKKQLALFATLLFSLQMTVGFAWLPPSPSRLAHAARTLSACTDNAVIIAYQTQTHTVTVAGVARTLDNQALVYRHIHADCSVGYYGQVKIFLSPNVVAVPSLHIFGVFRGAGLTQWSEASALGTNAAVFGFHSPDDEDACMPGHPYAFESDTGGASIASSALTSATSYTFPDIYLIYGASGWPGPTGNCM